MVDTIASKQPKKKQKVRAKDRREMNKAKQMTKYSPKVSNEVQVKPVVKQSENRPPKKKRIRAKDRRESIGNRGLNVAKQAASNEIESFKQKSTIDKGLYVAEVGLKVADLYVRGKDVKKEGVKVVAKQLLEAEKKEFTEGNKREKLQYAYNKGKKVSNKVKNIQALDAQAEANKNKSKRQKASDKVRFEDSDFIKARRQRAAYNNEKLELERKREARRKRKAIEKEQARLEREGELSSRARKQLKKELKRVEREEKLNVNSKTGTISYDFSGVEFSIKTSGKNSSREVLSSKVDGANKEVENPLKLQDVESARKALQLGSKIATKMGYANAAAGMSKVASALGPWGVALVIGLELITNIINEQNKDKAVEEEVKLIEEAELSDTTSAETLDTLVEYEEEEVEEELQEIEVAEEAIEEEQQEVDDEIQELDTLQEEAEVQEEAEELEDELIEEEEVMVEEDVEGEELTPEQARERVKMDKRVYDESVDYFGILLADISRLADMDESDLTFMRFKRMIQERPLPPKRDKFWKYALEFVSLPSNFDYDSDGAGDIGILIGYQDILDQVHMLYDTYQTEDLDYITQEEYNDYMHFSNVSSAREIYDLNL